MGSYIRPHRLAARTAGSHPANLGSIPNGVTFLLSSFSSFVFVKQKKGARNINTSYSNNY